MLGLFVIKTSVGRHSRPIDKSLRRHFCSIAYDLPKRSRGRIYELNAKIERAYKVEQFVQFSALCKQY